MSRGSDKILFCLADFKEGWIVRDLTFGEVQAILATRPRELDVQLFFWTEPWDQWKTMTEPEGHAFLVPRRETQNPPPERLVRIAPVNKGQSVRRSIRFPVQMPVVVQTTVSQFSTWTVDVSEGGVRLLDPLPDHFAGYSQVVLMPENHLPIHLLASPVEDQKDGRYHLEFMDSEEQAQFIKWMREQDWARAS